MSAGAEAQLAHAALERALGDLEPLHHGVQVALALLEAAEISSGLRSLAVRMRELLSMST